MSASPPALPAPPTMPAMVSRLPKFGFRPAPSAPSAPAPPAAATAAGVTAVGGADPSAPLTNGAPHHQTPPGPAPSAGGPVRNSGLLRMPAPPSLSWTKKGKAGGERAGVPARKSGATAPSDVIAPPQPLPPQQQPSPLTTQRWLKKPTPPVVVAAPAKGRGFGFGVASAGLPQPGPKGPPAVKNGPGATRLGQKLAAPGLTNGTNPNLNARAGSPRLGGSRPASRSGSPLLSARPAARSQSSDSLRPEGPGGGGGGGGGGGPSVRLLSEKDRLRSRSLNQVQRRPWSMPAPTALSSLSSQSTAAAASPRITRSYSLNRAADRGGKEPLTPPSSRLQLPKAPPIRAGLAKHLPWADASATAAAGKGQGLTKTAPPASSLKKPLLLPSTYLAHRVNGLAASGSRPSLIRQPRPLRVTPATRSPNHPREGGVQGAEGRRNSLESPSVTPSTTENSPGSTPEAAERVSHGEVSLLGETLEDMSLSSTSSLERNDTSQEYMDDFDNLGNGGVGILLLSTNDGGEDLAGDRSGPRSHDVKVLRSSEATRKSDMHSFLGGGVDWAGMRLGGDPEDFHLSRLTRQRRPSQSDYQEQGGSSLDLSPSDSCGSGGTYMWDEEGLEPLEGAVTTATTITATANTGSTAHHMGSYDSALNSIDLLNNLDSCELDDDDLMLDEDLPEDTSLHSDGDGISHMGQWRMPQLCWGTQDIHNDNSEFQSYHLAEDPGNQRSDKDLILGLSTARSTGISSGLGIDLDLNLDLGLGMDLGLGIDVEELADNCSAVRAQLEHLQRLLLQEGGAEEEDLEDTLTTDTLSPEDSNRPDEQLSKQVSELLCEVQQLKEDVRRRDQTIAQLTQQLGTQTVPVATSRCHCRGARADGATQTGVADGGKPSLHQASQTPWREPAPQVLPSPLRLDHQGHLTPKDPAPTPPSPPTHPATPQARPSSPGQPARRQPRSDNADLERPVTPAPPPAPPLSPPPPPPGGGGDATGRGGEARARAASEGASPTRRGSGEEGGAEEEEEGEAPGLPRRPGRAERKAWGGRCLRQPSAKLSLPLLLTSSPSSSSSPNVAGPPHTLPRTRTPRLPSGPPRLHKTTGP